LDSPIEGWVGVEGVLESADFLNLATAILLITIVLWREPLSTIASMGDGSWFRILRRVALLITVVACTLLFVAVVDGWLLRTGRVASVKSLMKHGLSVDASWAWAVPYYAVYALAEECIYRGAVYQAFKTRTAPWAAGVLSALLFSLTHMYPLHQAIVVFIFGLAMTWLVERTRSLGPATLLHAAFNLLQFAVQR
jgi:membrane protease YdiL (CAAX protease family)